MKLEWKEAGPDGWSSKPYQTARRGKLSFRLRPRTPSERTADIAVCHDDFEYGPGQAADDERADRLRGDSIHIRRPRLRGELSLPGMARPGGRQRRGVHREGEE